MASQLLNRIYQVSWNDFHMQPPPGATRAAHIETKAALSYSYKKGAGGVQLTDSVTVTIQVLRHLSWAKKQLIRTWSPQAQSDLLLHEQGHYNVTALMGRDLFLDIMALKGRSFASETALKTEIGRIAAIYAPQPIQTAYDSKRETNHGDKATQQRAWNGYIQTAFNQQRTPLVKAPDGASYKSRLRDVLKAAGKI